MSLNIHPWIDKFLDHTGQSISGFCRKMFLYNSKRPSHKDGRFELACLFQMTVIKLWHAVDCVSVSGEA